VLLLASVMISQLVNNCSIVISGSGLIVCFGSSKLQDEGAKHGIASFDLPLEVVRLTEHHCSGTSGLRYAGCVIKWRFAG